MYKHKSIIPYIKRYAPINTYLHQSEILDMINDLTKQESDVYLRVRTICTGNFPASALENTELANTLNLTKAQYSNIKSTLKTKGYMVMVWGANNDGDKRVDVHLGKEQVQWYNWGLRVEISNAKAHRKLLEKFPIDAETLTPEERTALVEAANKEYLQNIEMYK